jgi:hypothetical protein
MPEILGLKHHEIQEFGKKKTKKKTKKTNHISAMKINESLLKILAQTCSFKILLCLNLCDTISKLIS